MSAQRGFTLLELLVAIAVFAVIAVAAYAGLRSVLFTRQVVEQEAQRLGRVQLTFAILTRDLEQVINRPIRDEFGQTQPALKGGGVTGPALTLTRTGWDNPLRQPRAGLQRVAWELEDDHLIRQYWITLDRSGIAEPRRAALLEGVEALRSRFLDSAGEWRTEWPPRDATGDTPSLPRAVELTVELADWGPITRLLPLAGFGP